MGDPVLSVVMPCLDGMRYLPRAIDSVRNVLPAESVEIVVADGGSTDGSLEYLRGQTVTLLEGPDTSLYEGLNRAIARARGPYVIWLNSDDTLQVGMASLLRKAREGDADIATGEAELATGEGTTSWRSDHHRRQASAQSLLFGVPTVNSRIFSRRLLEQAGPFRADIGLGADRHMLLRLLRLAPRRVLHDQAVYRYHQHGGSRTMAATWHSYRNVHAAHLTMVEALASEHRQPTEHDALAAFECVSSLAAARASVLAGDFPSGLRRAIMGLVHHPYPARWLHAMRLRRCFRGLGSGW